MSRYGFEDGANRGSGWEGRRDEKVPRIHGPVAVGAAETRPEAQETLGQGIYTGTEARHRRVQGLLPGPRGLTLWQGIDMLLSERRDGG